MTTKNVKDFLNDFSPEELINRDILNYLDNRLNNLSVQPLLGLMKEKGVSRLEWPPHKWFFGVDGNFGNKNVNYLKEGNIKDLQQVGELFMYMNTTINPFYRNWS